MKRTISIIAGFSSVITVLALVGPVAARAPAPITRSRLSYAPAGSPAPRAPRAGTHEVGGVSASGRQVYMRNCARCHGGDAIGKKGPALVGRSLNQDEIEEMVSAGQPPRMPAFGKRLSPDEISAVAAYVRSLGGRS